MIVKIKKHLFIMAGMISFAMLLVAGLAWSALKPINADVSFERNVIQRNVTLTNIIEKPTDVLELAGATDYNLFFRTKDANRIFNTNTRLEQQRYFSLGIKENEKVNSYFKIIVDSPQINICAGNIPAIIRVTPGLPPTFTKFSNNLFTRTAQISHNTFALRIYEGIDQIFAKGNFQTGELLQESGVSEKKQDAGLSTDGALHFDNKTNQLVYVEYYNNEVICLDTNLHLKRRMKTIDNLRASFQAGETPKKDRITSFSPRRMGNPFSAVSDGILYNNSMIKSKSDSNERFGNNSIFDLYDLYDYKYIGSIYIPFYKKERMRSFRIIKDQLIAMYKDAIVSYKIQ